MAASSITKNFVIADKDDVEAFADALEKACLLYTSRCV